MDEKNTIEITIPAHITNTGGILFPLGMVLIALLEWSLVVTNQPTANAVYALGFTIAFIGLVLPYEWCNNMERYPESVLRNMNNLWYATTNIGILIALAGVIW